MRKHIFKLVTFAALGLSAPIYAVSFDCTKAQTNVEKMICADAELSKLDEDLATAYATALKTNGKTSSIRQAQKLWMKERNNCLDAACLVASYNRRIAFLTAQSTSNKNAVGTEPRKDSAAPAAKALAPFTFNIGPSWSRDSDLFEQKTAPVCQDLLIHLNHPRSNQLFKPDGTLVREGEKIKSVQWERLDKAEYREGFMTVLNTLNAPNIREDYLQIYADSEWILERALAHPFYPKPDSPEKWLYRLVTTKPYPRNWSDSISKLELPTWFPYTSINWLGDQQGKRHIADVYRMYGGHIQWFEHNGKTYAIDNATSGGGKGAKPKYLELEIYKLIFDAEGHSFLRPTCTLRARNNE